MSEGMLMETLIAVGAVVVVFGAVGAILYRITIGDSSAKRLEKLKNEIEKEKK